MESLAPGIKDHSFGHSKASARYDAAAGIGHDRYDRTIILLQWIGTEKRVLEVGCSTGYFSRLVVQQKCDVTGIEVDPEAAARARAYCRDVLVRDLNAADWMVGIPEGAFDVVLLGDVLEHLTDPALALSQSRRFLGRDGSVVISLPNIVHWYTRLAILLGRFNYEPTGTLDHTHLRFFTVKTAQEMIEAAGFQVMKFHPAIGGRFSRHIRPIWQFLARLLPGVFAYQLLFEAKTVRDLEAAHS